MADPESHLKGFHVSWNHSLVGHVLVFLFDTLSTLALTPVVLGFTIVFFVWRHTFLLAYRLLAKIPSQLEDYSVATLQVSNFSFLRSSKKEENLKSKNETLKVRS